MFLYCLKYLPKKIVPRSLSRLAITQVEQEKLASQIEGLAGESKKIRGMALADSKIEELKKIAFAGNKDQPQDAGAQVLAAKEKQEKLVNDLKLLTDSITTIHKSPNGSDKVGAIEHVQVQKEIATKDDLDWSGNSFQKYGWNNPHIKGPVPLVVSGTDGSGTRSVVDLLLKLGVTMVIDDHGTNDVEGYELGEGGWPPPVRKVLDASHSLNYEVDMLPAGVQQSVGTSIRNFLSSMASKAQQGWHAAQMRRYNAKAASVSWGFKAPVSMCLVPFLYDDLKKMKVLHVVRDGRDIAFSGNQSPVKKFYNNQYTQDRGLVPEAKAIQLWSDQNVQLLEWELKHRDSETFDFLVVRTEDLVGSETRFAVSRQIARFVGSSIPDRMLCCIAKEGNKDLGSHSNLSGQVSKRYGKWHERVKNNPGLHRVLHAEGKQGLDRFGYQPEREGDKVPCECDDKPVQRKCSFEENTDYKGIAGSDISYQESASRQDCCNACGSFVGCTHFTFVSNMCYLKNSVGERRTAQGLVSGYFVT